jgi:SpoVK/Ycf46/Vps4 family AAA+-type ATPase
MANNASSGTATRTGSKALGVSQADHAVQYEDWLLKYRNVTDRFNDVSVSNQHQADENAQNALLGQLCASAVAVRAGRMGSLQCAVQDAASNSTVDADATRQLMYQARMQMERDATSTEQMTALDTMIPTLKNNHTNRLPLQSVQVDVDAFFEEFPECIRSDWNDPESESEGEEEEEDSRRKRRPRKPDTNRQQQDVPPASQQQQQLETRDIPPQIPAAASNPYGAKARQENPYAVRARQETIPNQPQQQQQNAAPYETVDLTTLPNRQNLPTQGQAPPHFHQQSYHQQPQPGPVDPPPTSHQRRPPPPPLPPQPNPSMQQGSHQAWDDHQSKNPFQTAREYAGASDKKENRGPSNNARQQNHQPQYHQPPPPQQYHHPPPPQQHQHAPQPPGGNHNPYGNTAHHNPYGNTAPAAAGWDPNDDNYNDSPADQQPTHAIRDSLKRKFQIPKRGAAPNGNDTQHTQNNTSGRNQGGNSRDKSINSGGALPPGMSARPPSTNANNDSKNNNEEEDELPEELKRFGKELVEKIENEIMDSGDPVTFDDIAGLADAKQTVQEVVCWPMKRPDLFTGLRRAPNGLLLYGPPGTGKTLIGKAIAYESGATFFSISSSSLTSKWIGEGEKLVRTMFAVAAYKEPAVIFIDEIDSLLTARKADENEASRRIKTEFLVQLDGTGTSGQGRVLVIGATNRPQELDEAARRRFTKRLYIPLPEELDRELLLGVLLGKNNHRLVDADIKKLAKETEGFSGADLKSLSTDAAMGPIRQLGARALEVDVKDVPPISYKHFRQALRGMRPSVAPSDLVQYLEWDRLFGSKRAEADNDDDDSDEDD